MAWKWLTGVEIGARSSVRRRSCNVLGVMLRAPFLGRFMCPFEVAGLGVRYLWTFLAKRWGALLRNPALIAMSSYVIHRLHRLWCMNFTVFAFVVRW